MKKASSNEKDMDRIEKILASFDDTPEMRANPYLETRLIEWLDNPPVESQVPLRARRLGIAGVSLLTVLNVVVVVFVLQTSGGTSAPDNIRDIDSYAAGVVEEYGLMNNYDN